MRTLAPLNRTFEVLKWAIAFVRCAPPHALNRTFEVLKSERLNINDGTDGALNRTFEVFPSPGAVLRRGRFLLAHSFGSSTALLLMSTSSRDRLLHLLRAGHVLTTAEAAQRLGVSRRQVSRAAKALISDGVPVEKSKAGKMHQYALPEGERYPESTDAYTENQLLALIVAIEAGRSLLRPTPLAAPLRAVHAQLLDRIPARNVFTLTPSEEPARWYFQEAPSVDIAPEVFNTVRTAVHEQRTISIDYVNASRQTTDTGRVIDPLVIGTRKGAWLCAAYCHRRDAIRDFNLADIQSITVQERYFDPPSDFDAAVHFGTRFGATTGASHVVRIRVAPDAARYFYRKEYHPTQQIEHTGEDGHLVVSYDVDGLRDVRSWVRSWGPKNEVLAPDVLIQQIQADAEAVAAQYASSS